MRSRAFVSRVGGLVLISWLTACGGAAAPIPEALDGGPSQATSAVAPPQTARALLLASPARAVVVPFDSSGSITGHAIRESAADAQLTLQAQGGAIPLALTSDGGEQLLIHDVHLALEPVSLTQEELPPSGLAFKDLAVDVDGPLAAPVRWYGGGEEGTATFTGTLRFSGDLALPDGGSSPFDPQVFDGLTFDADVTTDAFGDLQVRFRLDQPGVVWSWQGLYETEALHFEGRAVDGTPAEEASRP